MPERPVTPEREKKLRDFKKANAPESSVAPSEEAPEQDIAPESESDQLPITEEKTRKDILSKKRK